MLTDRLPRTLVGVAPSVTIAGRHGLDVRIGANASFGGGLHALGGTLSVGTHF